MMRAVSWCVRHGVHQKITVGSPHRSARRRQAAHSSCRRWPAVGGGWPLLPTARGELALTHCVAPGWRRRQDGAAGTPHTIGFKAHSLKGCASGNVVFVSQN